MTIQTRLEAQIIYGADYWEHLTGEERRIIELNETEPSDEDIALEERLKIGEEGADEVLPPG